MTNYDLLYSVGTTIRTSKRIWRCPMKFNMLNENKLQIIISQKDLSSRNLKKWDLVPYNPSAQALFQEILEHANEACGFEVMRDTQLVVEAYPITGDSMIMTITKIGEGNYQQMLEDLEKFQDTNTIKDFLSMLDEKEYVIYEVPELESMIEIAHFIHEGYQDESSLYKGDKGQYYLVLEAVDKLEAEYFGHLIEYAVPTTYSKAFLHEYTTCIIPENAIGHLSRI